MATSYQEYIAPQGTLVKPYSWLQSTEGCRKCPYHIKTGEEARVSFLEFYETFGFPYGQPQSSRHFLFYELKLTTGTFVQKGQVTNCTSHQLHPESMLFNTDGYLDSLMYSYGNVAYITLYTNYTPCNESTHQCVSKMYDFLLNYPSTRLDIYFSQLYHTDEGFPEAGWNRQALHSLAALWPRVTISPICSGIWAVLAHRFVNGIPPIHCGSVLPARASADCHNARQIAAITGVNPSYADAFPQGKPVNLAPVPKPPPLPPVSNVGLMAMQQQYAGFLNAMMAPWSMKPNPPQAGKRKNVVRHLNMPRLSERKPPASPTPGNRRPVEVNVFEIPTKRNSADSKKYRTRGKKQMFSSRA
ncbi:putative C-_U-editing enzyme APOBEC-4 [Callorhinchus milii]|uniref:putative C->U-editing enzyme APOBEC-4 n=1 Tax=Callorhinchus milii TaxID=7868 RepID=UPI00045721EE|nr:putative C->U-editing enzyme APOBEC-4 [Callorhinchus milii]|eukprot:gi/632956264/ref/XP_007893871.1/ PREDICTED: putative C-_U-editing enzyme APOBEC-4 [Callorhinchus milii]